MTNAELLAKIKAEIGRQKEICTAQIKANPGQTLPFVMEMTGYDKLLSFLSTLESEKTISPWKKIHTYTEELHEGDMEKMLLELSVGKGEKRTKVALPDRIVDILESKKLMNLKEEINRTYHDGSVADTSNIDHVTYENIARHFAEWGAEHLKK